MNKTIKVLLSLIIATVIITTPLVSVFAAAFFRGGGDIYLAGNTSNPSAGWGDPMSAQNGDIFDFKVAIYNDGDQPAQNVRVKADLPTNVSGTNVTSVIHITSDNTPEVTDTATVVGPQNSTTKSLTYFQGNGGHAVYIDNAGTHTLPETIATSGVTIGTVNPGPQNRVDIVFKATYSETPVAAVAPTATPTPTSAVAPTATPTPVPNAPTATPTPAPQGGQQGTVQCPAGYTQTVNGNNIICIQNQNQNTNNNSASASTGAINVTLQGSTAAAAAPAAPAVVNKAPVGEVKTLPKTGLPIGVWALSGLLPVGIGLKRKFLNSDSNESSASYVWENREFLKNIWS